MALKLPLRPSTVTDLILNPAFFRSIKNTCDWITRAFSLEEKNG
jgi:hypothetical protein